MLDGKTNTFVKHNSSTEFLINQCLSQVSTDEIYEFVNRLNFYLEHFKVININNSAKKQIEFLNKAKNALKNELNSRNGLTYSYCRVEK